MHMHFFPDLVRQHASQFKLVQHTCVLDTDFYCADLDARYTESAFQNEMLPTSVPEIQRTNLGMTCLTLKVRVAGAHSVVTQRQMCHADNPAGLWALADRTAIIQLTGCTALFCLAKLCCSCKSSCCRGALQSSLANL